MAKHWRLGTLWGQNKYSCCFLQLPSQSHAISAQRLPQLQWISWAFNKLLFPKRLWSLCNLLLLPHTVPESSTAYLHSAALSGCQCWSLWDARQNFSPSGSLFFPLIGPIWFTSSLAFLVLVPDFSFWCFNQGLHYTEQDWKAWVVTANWNLSIPSTLALREKNQYLKNNCSCSTVKWMCFFCPARMCHLECFISYIVEIIAF